MKEDELEHKTIERYLLNEMNNEERNAFEDAMNNDPELKEKVALHKAVRAMDDKEDWLAFEGDPEILKKEAALFRSEETVQFSEKLKAFRNSHSQGENKRSISWFRKPIWGVVAAILIIAVFVFYPKTPDMTSLYNEYSDWGELPSLITKGDDTDSLKRMEYLFQSKDYKGVIDTAEKLPPSVQKSNPQTLLYLGVSYLELNAYDDAVGTFQKLLQSNSIDFHKGYWYLALSFLKQENKDKAIENLEVIAENPSYYNHAKAKKLLKQLR